MLNYDLVTDLGRFYCTVASSLPQVAPFLLISGLSEDSPFLDISIPHFKKSLLFNLLYFSPVLCFSFMSS